ncbi:hypothetical protein JVU11DRAFT_8651 [Chiua virens]|nr:hypothetical protein JVU11DRAFT_8651 [Chiua virens]
MMLMSVGSSLSSFKSQKELLLGLIEGFEIHQRLSQEQGILHRAISPSNLVFQSDDAPIRKVMLVDFDYAAQANYDDTVKYPSGTSFPPISLPFLSLRILRGLAHVEMKDQDLQVQHEIGDDLESFFYVFVWICVFFSGPNGAVRPHLEDESDNSNSFVLHTWGLDTTGKGLTIAGKLLCTWDAKRVFLYSPVDFDIQAIEGFTPYFSNLKKLAVEWKELAKKEAERRYVGGTDTPLTHRAIIELLRSHVDALEDIPPRMLKRGRHNSYGSIGTQ